MPSRHRFAHWSTRLWKWLLLFLPAFVFAQPIAITPPGTSSATGLRVTISQQGLATLRDAAGGKLKGIGIGAIHICNLGAQARPVDSEVIYQGIQELDVEPLLVMDAQNVLTRSADTSLAQMFIDGGAAGASIVGFLGSLKSIRMSNGLAAGLSFAPMAVGGAKYFFGKRVAKPVNVTANILSGTYALLPRGTAGACIAGGKLFVYHYGGKWSSRKEIILP